MAIGHVESDIAAEQRRISQAETEVDICIFCDIDFDSSIRNDGYCSDSCKENDLFVEGERTRQESEAIELWRQENDL